MDISPLVERSKLLIKKFSSTAILVNDVYYYEHFILAKNKIVLQQKERFNIDDVGSLLQGLEAPEVLLYATGFGAPPINAEWLKKLKQLGVSFDIMDSAAACRTYNILVSEDRDVLLILNLN